MAAYSLGDILAGNADLQPKSSTAKVRSVRSKNRAGAWAQDLARWHGYHTWKAKTDAEREALDTEYARRLEAGPDFTHYRARSDYSAPHVHQLAAEDRREVLAAFDAVADWLYERRRKHGQRVSGRYRDVLRYLLNTALRFGKVFPSYSRIAERVQCSRRTVVSAVQWLATWGFLSWQRRIKRTAAGVVRQTTNAYQLALKGLAAIGERIFRKRECRTFPASASPISKPESTDTTRAVQEKGAA